MFLLDTCVFSEFARKAPDQQVVQGARTIPEADIFLSSLVLGELLRGIVRMPEGCARVSFAITSD